jgi:DNA-directed RNA polymerase specialized sigma24 family protein
MSSQESPRDGEVISVLLSQLDKQQIAQILGQVHDELVRRGEAAVQIPLEIFATELSPGEAIVKYLKEEKHLRYSEIGLALGRDERGIWSTYQRAERKMPSAFGAATSGLSIPVTALAERKLSLLENVMVHLVDTLHVPIKDCAELLKKSYSTLYTTYARAKRKLAR